MSITTILSLIAFPTIFVGLLALLNEKIKHQMKMTVAVQVGVQALLRDRLYQLYRFCAQKGSATTYQRENFENMWNQYEQLGKNGVMKDVHDKFMALPIEADEF
jgi:hypothetical protein